MTRRSIWLFGLCVWFATGSRVAGGSPTGGASQAGSLPETQSTPADGEVKTNATEGLGYVWIPAGSFEMGCAPGDTGCDAREQPRRRVVVERGFWLGRTEVTVGAYRRFARAAGRAIPPAPDFNPRWAQEDHPMVRVSWHDASAYCAWSGGRLPTGAEWEYAARGGRDAAKYPWGDTASHEHANYGKDQCCGGRITGRDRWLSTSPVGSFPANGFGLHDMSGNVWEWCADRYADDLAKPPAGGPPDAASGAARVLRGGSWSSDPWLLRLSYRLGSEAGDDSNYGGGFRCARDLRP